METLKSLIAANKKKMELLEKALKECSIKHSFQASKTFVLFEFNNNVIGVEIAPNGSYLIDTDSFKESKNKGSKIELYAHYEIMDYKNKVLTFKKDHTVNDIYPEKLVIDFN